MLSDYRHLHKYIKWAGHSLLLLSSMRPLSYKCRQYYSTNFAGCHVSFLLDEEEICHIGYIAIEARIIAAANPRTDCQSTEPEISISETASPFETHEV